ncbi:cysteine dioxygenase family protein [Psychroserpens sp.]|uniref:cysteine dioxygenase n=1 Tax=Psychroserpens sp. TaxID=2020870 RepID=UPI001B008FDA|nr:cysteine dioxygenase family protein [Psychroserpens sp.]MBO6605906.1 cysteine dioxygenase family protein [Psychroserpens sp.]MBO6630681.1 cysteine dioxygenase family protein [Psychroserpens sp.]MBO6652723.1 cysteine dioxygenase family protein [Psychroserpens sp.]MBO6681505.1 cysteine dioxygenase family protein [Psychroserpens sp.]MBO6749280.1 cysteine dioxygenase family protein [Psychroserpens sp.]
MKTETPVQRLISQLSQSAIKDYTTLLENFDFDAIDFKSFESWSDKRYTRNCIYKDEQFEVLLLCWRAGQQTSIHGHDGEDCWVYMLEGEITEVFYLMDADRYLREDRSHKIKPKQLTFMNDKLGYHKLSASDQCDSVSLHIYAKPIEECLSFDFTEQCFVKRKLFYDTHQDVMSNPLVRNIH